VVCSIPSLGPQADEPACICLANSRPCSPIDASTRVSGSVRRRSRSAAFQSRIGLRRLFINWTSVSGWTGFPMNRAPSGKSPGPGAARPEAISPECRCPLSLSTASEFMALGHCYKDWGVTQLDTQALPSSLLGYASTQNDECFDYPGAGTVRFRPCVLWTVSER
jgi:hypothetical protein